jgi:hypothetical protein
MHKLSDLTESAKVEGFARPQQSAPEKKEKTPSEPWLRNRLRQHVPFWKSFCTSLFVLSVLTIGYQLPWSPGAPPGPKFMPNHPSAFQHPEFVTEAVSALVATGAAMEVSFRPFIVSPLGVVPKALDKLRLILDLCYVNSFLRVDSFRYESLKEVSTLCKLKDFLFTVDLNSGYHHIDVDPAF